MLLSRKQTEYYKKEVFKAGLLTCLAIGVFPSLRTVTCRPIAFERDLQQRVLFRIYTGFPIKQPTEPATPKTGNEDSGIHRVTKKLYCTAYSQGGQDDTYHDKRRYGMVDVSHISKFGMCNVPIPLADIRFYHRHSLVGIGSPKRQSRIPARAASGYPELGLACACP